MRKNILLILGIFAVLSLAATVSAADYDDTTIPGLNITTDASLAFDMSQSQNKTLAIIFDSDSCVYCDIFKEDTLSDSDVQKELNENFIVFLADINKNPDIAEEYNIFGTPIVQFVDSTGHPIEKVEGSVGSDDFLKTLKEI